MESSIIGRMQSFKDWFRGYEDNFVVKLRVRFSMRNLTLGGDLLNIPLFLADQTDKLIGLAMEQNGA